MAQGEWLQATSLKRQAGGSARREHHKLQASSPKPGEKVPSLKRQAASLKRQAASDKLHDS